MTSVMSLAQLISPAMNPLEHEVFRDVFASFYRIGKTHTYVGHSPKMPFRHIAPRLALLVDRILATATTGPDALYEVGQIFLSLWCPPSWRPANLTASSLVENARTGSLRARMTRPALVSKCSLNGAGSDWGSVVD